MRRAIGRVLVVVSLVLIAAGAADLAHMASLLPGSSGGTQFQPAPTYGLPSPSYWPLSPYPLASARHDPTPQVTVSPCPSWAPTLVQHPDGSYECKAYIPPDPGGPVLASPTP